MPIKALTSIYRYSPCEESFESRHGSENIMVRPALRDPSYHEIVKEVPSGVQEITLSKRGS